MTVSKPTSMDHTVITEAAWYTHHAEDCSEKDKAPSQKPRRMLKGGCFRHHVGAQADHLRQATGMSWDPTSL